MKRRKKNRLDWTLATVDIDDFVDINDDLVRVTVSATGQPHTINRRYIKDGYPGGLIVYAWLARILLKPQTEEGTNHESGRL